ncbi:MAG: OmpA family protein [Desulfobacula sp.]|nr:OmpA family protein [Desulfobacula sp.]
MSSKATDSHTLNSLKDLLLKPEQKQIQRIEKRLDDPMIRANEISNALPDAISLSMMGSDKLPRAIQPVIDGSLKISVQKNPKAYADAIFPALGPGIRKAISSTLMGMIQSLNQALNHSFSLNGLKWRYEALKTGKPFAEVILLNTLVFQVEQIFLIHKDTGIVLEHVVAKDAIIQDPDLVSGMLRAIQDFVKDSFSTDSDDDLETLRIGSNRTVWIEKGEHALIASVLRGTPPLDLRIQYQELLEEIHLKSSIALANFDGNPSPFAFYREPLKDGLKSKAKTDKIKISPLLLCVFIFIFALIFYWGFTKYQNHQIWQGYIARLESQKGLILLSTKKKNRHYYISGLRDPLAHNPDDLLKENEKRQIFITSHWTPFYSLDPKFVIQRARLILAPPSTITLSLSGNTLYADGIADQMWIEQFKRISVTLPGIDRYNDDKIQNTDRHRLVAELKALSDMRIYFKNNRSRLVKGQEDFLNQVLQKLLVIQTLQSRTSLSVQIIIFGHTDSSGTEKLNLKLSRNRAEKVFNYLLVNGINPAFLTLSGVGTQRPLANEKTLDDRRYNRAVSFKTFYINSIRGNL